jgi:hypothetical protein
MVIVAAAVPLMNSFGVNAGSTGQYGGDFYWQGGSSNILPGEHAAWLTPIWSSDFGFLLVCGISICSHSLGGITLGSIVLQVHETAGPWLASPTGLWQTTGWVSGTWPLNVWGDSPSGVCAISASLAGKGLPGSTSVQDRSTWHQCAAGTVADSVVTGGGYYGQGAETLRLHALDAAGETVDYAKTVYVDNQPPAVSLSGPTNAPSTAGTQYIRVTATAGPSGVYGIACSTDGAPTRWYLARTASIPVRGVGEHRVRCLAENNARGTDGRRGESTWRVFAMKIGEPTVSGITFGHMVNAPRCKRVKERVTVRGRWVTVHRGHRPVWVWHRGHTRTTKVTRCRPRTKMVRVTVRVRVRRHGQKAWVTRRRRERVALLPHVVNSTTLRVRHGHGATVSGWLGDYTGVALAGRQVAVLSTPDNGLGGFTLAATATTAANGTWSATLPPGPSRLVEAVYYGGPTTEASVSGQAKLIVPAKVKLLRVSPRRVPWSGRVRIVGQLVGGYLPPGGALVRLRIGLGLAFTTYGVHEHVGGKGRFTTTYTFGVGDARLHRSYWFQIASLPMGNYPYAPANSRRISVLVGGHPTRARHVRG